MTLPRISVRGQGWRSGLNAGAVSVAVLLSVGCEQQNRRQPDGEAAPVIEPVLEEQTGDTYLAEEYETIAPPPTYEPRGPEPLTAEQWRAITNREAFERRKPIEPPDADKLRKDTGFGSQKFYDSLSTVAWVLVVVLLAAGLAYGVYRFRRKPDLGISRRDYSATDTLLNTAPDALAADLADKLGARDYRMAIRLRFGQVLQELRARRLLVWVPGATNHEYEQVLPPVLRTGFASLAEDFAFATYAGRQLDGVYFRGFADKAENFLLAASAPENPRQAPSGLGQIPSV